MKPLLVAWDFFGVINAVRPEELQLVLQALMDLGSEQIIVSHSTQAEIEGYLELHRLKQFFVSIYGAEWHLADPGMGKAPALRDFIQTSGEFKQMFMVGDGMNDMDNARQVKMKAILFDINRYYTSVVNEADWVVDSLESIVSIVKGENV